MTKRRLLKTICLVVCLLMITAGIASAMSSANYAIPADTLEGGGSGGGIARSTSYQAVVSFGPTVQPLATSANYQICSGFLCSFEGVINLVFYQVFLPFTSVDL